MLVQGEVSSKLLVLRVQYPNDVLFFVNHCQHSKGGNARLSGWSSGAYPTAEPFGTDVSLYNEMVVTNYVYEERRNATRISRPVRKKEKAVSDGCPRHTSKLYKRRTTTTIGGSKGYLLPYGLAAWQYSENGFIVRRRQACESTATPGDGSLSAACAWGGCSRCFHQPLRWGDMQTGVGRMQRRRRDIAAFVKCRGYFWLGRAERLSLSLAL